MGHTPGKVPKNGTFDVTADFYRRYRSDIQLMRDLNLQSYSFEVYWPRIFPNGTGKVNEPGLDFYDQLVDEFLAAGIIPLCNLFVFDHPAGPRRLAEPGHGAMVRGYASILFG